MRRKARWLPALRLPALLFGGALCALACAAFADEATTLAPLAATADGKPADPSAASAASTAAPTADAAGQGIAGQGIAGQKIVDQEIAGKQAAGGDERRAALPEATGRSTATAGDPYGHLVPVQVIPKVHLVEPSLSGAFAAPDAAVDGKLATFGRSALAVPRGFALRQPVDRNFTPWPAGGAVPSLVMAPTQPPVAIGGETPAAADAAGASSPEKQAAAVPVAPVQTLTPAPAEAIPDASVRGPAEQGAANADTAAPPAPPAAAAAPQTAAPRAADPARGAAREAHHMASGQAKHHPTARIERVRRDTAKPASRARTSRRNGGERYDDLPELAPLPPGVLPPQP